ncbi:hypothetical protein BDB01DRAFT_835394 [Pilobolus umbonatus]|nr:hypothetical protein BDB01DRAFT_835394 [Pilobolus umbonatus]
MKYSIYIIKLKLTDENLQLINQYIMAHESLSVCESIDSAEYAVTQLKSPCRIQRHLKPTRFLTVLHVDWLLKSIQQKTLLDPIDYRIDMNTQHENMMINNYFVQLSWDQIAERYFNGEVIPSGGGYMHDLYFRKYKRRGKQSQGTIGIGYTTSDSE